MKIRTRLILLAVGAIVIPIVIMLMVGYLSYRYLEEKKLITTRTTAPPGMSGPHCCSHQ